jgi:hypothetical protein
MCKVLDGNYHKTDSWCSKWHACTNKGTKGFTLYDIHQV